jgi:hypothetical protein
MFVHDNTCDIAMQYHLNYLPWLCETERIISSYVMLHKVAKASTIVTIACCSHWHYRLKNIANVNTAQGMKV